MSVAELVKQYEDERLWIKLGRIMRAKNLDRYVAMMDESERREHDADWATWFCGEMGSFLREELGWQVPA